MTPDQVIAYAAEYGLPDTKITTVRNDVRESLLNQTQACTAGEFWSVTA